ncbi:MAG: HD domain-containing protein [Alphaproteobacteria bacterium]
MLRRITADRGTAEGGAMERMHYRRMDEGTDEDFVVLRHVHEQTLRDLPDRLFAMLRDLRRDTAYNITRYDHSLQTATRALRDGRDEEYVAVALLHDVCEPLGPFNHGEVAAAILQPFISRDNHWMLVRHGLFQTYFYGRHMGLDPNARDIYKSDPAYEQTVEFCAKYDEISFDPDYRNEPLSTFEPMVRRLLQKQWVAPSQMRPS